MRTEDHLAAASNVRPLRLGQTRPASDTAPGRYRPMIDGSCGRCGRPLAQHHGLLCRPVELDRAA